MSIDNLPKVTIAIPSYNGEKVIRETIESCIIQDYPNFEIIVSDNGSTDNTINIVKEYEEIILYKYVIKQGIGPNLKNCIKKATGQYIVFISHDDLFTNTKVISDMVRIFESNDKIGHIGHFYYQFLNKYDGAVRLHRILNPMFSSCNFSGIAFRREAFSKLKILKVSNDAFMEAPSIVKQVLDAGWEYYMIKYDTIAVRIHPGGNTATKSVYYKTSPTMNWTNLIGKQDIILTLFISLIQLKNWTNYKILFREIWLFIKLRPKNLLRIDFWMFSLIAILTPKFILRPFTNWYKHRINRNFVKIIERPKEK